MTDIITVKGAKAGSGSASTPSIADDSVASTSTAKLLYGLAEGEVYGLVDGGKSIRLNGTPLIDSEGNENFEDVTWDFRSGTNEQEYIKGFPDVSNETGVNVELTSDYPWIQAFTDTQLSAVRVRLKWAALSKTDDESGDVKGYKIEYAIDLQTNGGAYVEVLNTSINDKTSTGYERTHRIDLPKSTTGWQIRVRRLTENSTSEYIQDTMYIDAVAEVIDVKLRYPNTALLGLQYNAETFSSIAKIEVHLRGSIIRVPSNYNAEARTYTGIWDGTFKDAYTNNPAWVYYDLCMQWRYGLGERLDASMIDKWSLYTLGQYCDDMVSDGQGGLEPRFTCNVYLQKQADAYQVLQNIGGIFRAMSYWNGEKVVLDADVPQDPIYTFSRANVIDGNFEYTGTRARDRHTLAKVAWDNPLNSFETTYEYVRDEKAMAKFGVKVLDLSAFGCTSQAQAQRAGLWALKTEQLETRQVSFGVGLDGAIPTIGNIINVSDELFAGRANGGRVSEVSGRRVKIDRDAVVNIGDVLTLNCSDGINRSRVVTAVEGRYIYTSTSIPNAESENVWAIETADLKLMRFRVMSITQNDDTTFAITAIQHEPQKYDAIDFGTDVKPTTITVVNPNTVDAPSSVTITSRHRVVQGQTITTLVIAWSQVSGAVSYDVEWRKDDGTWISLSRTGNVSAEVDGVYSGNYMARVRSVSAFDVQSNAATSSLVTIEGKVGLPPKIVGLVATGVLFGMELSWGFASGSGDAAYTEIETASAPNVNVAPLGQYSYPTNTHAITGLQGNLEQSYRARLIDKLGFKSEWSDWVTGTTDASADKVMELIQGQIDESALNDILTSKIADIEINKLAIGIEAQARVYSLIAANDRITDEAADRVEELRLASLRTDGLQSFADNLAVDVDTVTLAQIETAGGLSSVKERTEAIEIENGTQASKLTYLSSEIGMGYADSTQFANKERSTVWTFAKTVAHADYTNAQLITGLSADYQDSSARFTESIELLATKNEAVATKTTNLSVQMIGGYDGNDLTKINSGLLFEESKARATDVEALAEQISLLSAGVGEQFDSFDIWHFNKNKDGWTGGSSVAGFLRVQSETITSPAIDDLDGSVYKHVKLRIKKDGNLTWEGLLSYDGGSKTIPEPSFDTDGIAVVSWQMEWTSNITSFSLKLASSAVGESKYSIDWIAVGRPSPGASNASLLRESSVRASETSANASDLVALNSQINGGTGVPIESSITRKLETTADLASTTAKDVTGLKSTYDHDMYGYEGTVQTTARTLAEETRAEAERLDLLSAEVIPGYADIDKFASATRSRQWTYAKTVAADNYAANQRITVLSSSFEDSKAELANELFTLTTKDIAIASEISTLEAKTGKNYGLIQDLSLVVSTPTTGLAAKVTELSASATINAGAASAAQSAADAAATLAGNKGEVIFSSTEPSSDKRLVQNLWIDTSSGYNTPKRYAGGQWLTVTDNAAIAAKEAADTAIANAKTADDKAVVAQSAAEAAQEAADSALVKLTDISADGKLTAIEKKQVKLIWDDIKRVNIDILDRAVKYSVGSGSYTTAYSALETYLTPLLADLNLTSNITRATFDSRFDVLFLRRATLDTAIINAIKLANDAAQQAADDAAVVAGLANDKAVAALDDLADISADSKLTPNEKQQVKLILADITETDKEVRASADKYDISLSAYSAAYINLIDYLSPKLTALQSLVTDDIVRSVFDSYFSELYDERAKINVLVVSAAEKQAADAASAASAAQGSANSAISAASAAQTTANSAATAAAAATVKLTELAADDRLTPIEKNQVLTIWEEIKKTDVGIRASAVKYGVSTTAYDNVYVTLNDYLTPIMAVPDQNSTIVRDTFNGRFANLYTQRSALNNAIITAIKVANDAAAQAASNAAAAAKAADDKAVLAQSALTEIAADNKLTAVEKKQLVVILADINKTDTEVRSSAAKYSVSLTAYSAAYSALTSYINPKLTDMTATSTIDRAVFNDRFDTLYSERSTVNAAIVTTAEAATAAAAGIAAGAAAAAALAQSAADSAAQVAAAATVKLTDISTDNKLTAVEKKQVKLIWDDIKQVNTDILARAVQYSVGSGSYTTAYSALETYITPLLTDLNATSNITRTTFDSRFETLFTRRATLDTAIVAAIKSAGDATDSKAVNAAAAAASAQTTANSANASAIAATVKLTDIAADDKLTPLEKNQVATIWEEIKSADTSIRASAVKYGVSTVSYDNVYTALNSYLTPLMDVPEQTSTIVRSTFDGRFANLYARRAELNNAVVAATKAISDSLSNKLEPANLAILVEGSGAFAGEFGGISGQFTNFQGVVNGQKSAIETVTAVGNVERLKNEIAKKRIDQDVEGLSAQATALQDAIDNYTTKIADLVIVRDALASSENALRAQYNQQMDQLKAARTDAYAQKSVIADQVAQLNSEKAVLDSLKITETQVIAQHYIKMDSGGRIAGYGLLQNSDATFDFAVNVDKFYIAPPTGTSRGTSPFMVLTSSTVINGTTVPAGTYMQSAFIHNASIDTAKIKDAAITNAKVGTAAIKTANIDNLAVTTGKIANLAVDTLQIAGSAVTVPTIRRNIGGFDISGAENAVTVIHSTSVEYTTGFISVQFAYEAMTSASKLDSGKDAELYISIWRDAIELRRIKIDMVTIQAGNQNTYDSHVKEKSTTYAMILDTPSVGSHTYKVQAEVKNRDLATIVLTESSLVIMGVKK